MKIKQLQRQKRFSLFIKKAYEIIGIFLCAIAISSCQATAATSTQSIQPEKKPTTMETALPSKEVPESKVQKHDLQKEHLFLQADAVTLSKRYLCPEGYQRLQSPEDSFAFYLQSLPLKPYGEKALYFDGREKPAEGVYDSVVAMEIGTRDLHQCADAIMLLRADYLRKIGKSDAISFYFVDGFEAKYKTWKSGKRISVKGKHTNWIDGGTKGDSDASFRKYMDMVFAYAGTSSLEKELIQAKTPVEIGDVWIQGGYPGHAVIVVDVAQNKNTGHRVFLLAQSYMPAQETQILINPQKPELSPWYSFEEGAPLSTPQWHFAEDTRRRFP